MSFPVFFDTCALYGELVADLILRLAEERFYTPYWSTGVLEELERNLAERIGAARAARRVHAMNSAFPDAAVTGYDALVAGMTCDEKDRHVLAAAVHSPARTLVMFNLKDFPESSVAYLPMELKTPDEFLLDVFDLSPGRATLVCYEALRSYERYPQTPEDYAYMLQRSGVPDFAEEIYPGLAALSETSE